MLVFCQIFYLIFISLWTLLYSRHLCGQCSFGAILVAKLILKTRQPPYCGHFLMVLRTSTIQIFNYTTKPEKASTSRIKIRFMTIIPLPYQDFHPHLCVPGQNRTRFFSTVIPSNFSECDFHSDLRVPGHQDAAAQDPPAADPIQRAGDPAEDAPDGR